MLREWLLRRMFWEWFGISTQNMLCWNANTTWKAFVIAPGILPSVIEENFFRIWYLQTCVCNKLATVLNLLRLQMNRINRNRSSHTREFVKEVNDRHTLPSPAHNSSSIYSWCSFLRQDLTTYSSGWPQIHLLRLKAYTTTPNLHFVLWGVEGTGGVETLSGCAYVYLELRTQTVRLMWQTL